MSNNLRTPSYAQASETKKYLKSRSSSNVLSLIYVLYVCVCEWSSIVCQLCSMILYDDMRWQSTRERERERERNRKQGGPKGVKCDKQEVTTTR